jgi:heme-degrading monooxygenase HmoA
VVHQDNADGTEEGIEMEAVITRVVLNAGAASEWTTAMRDRMAAAESADGWIGGSVLAPEDDRNVRLIFGLWQSRAAWEQWHRDPAFRDTAQRLDGLERDSGQAMWHEVVYGGGRLRD